MVKVQARIEKELFRLKDEYKKLKMSESFRRITLRNKIFVLEWVLSDADVDLNVFVHEKLHGKGENTIDD